MREVHANGRSSIGAAEGLGLAAAPTFAAMAVLTGLLERGAPDVLCATAHGTSPLSGMVLMYLLMSAFHITPWLKLISRRHVPSPHQHELEPSS
jgi:hypothetical protein